MTLTAILVDSRTFEVQQDAATLAANFNANNPNHSPLSEQDRNDLNEMFLEAGLLTEMILQ